jgi:peptidyl-prolyl cis-trans isomerase SurA
MVALQQKDSLLNPEERINDIYKKLQQGEKFESLAKQFSDDKSSARNGGKLSPFKSGQLSSTIFEDQAFGLDGDGAISKPFKSEYGWHIVKRISYEPLKSFEDLKPLMESKVKRDSRSKLINEAMVEELKKRYEISYNNEVKAYFSSILDDNYFTRSWRLPEEFNGEETIFTIGSRSFTYDEFGRHLVSAQRLYANKKGDFSVIVDNEYDKFFENSILKYREDNLELENEEFANILKEYRDGLLLFDLMEKEIWNKAAKDTVGLEAYYQKNKSKYQWGERVDIVMATSANEAYAKKALKLMKKGKLVEDIKQALNTDNKNNIIFTTGVFNQNDSKLPSGLEIKKGLSKIYAHNDAYHVIDINAILPAGTKTLEEAKGSVINDYQNEIEANWIDSLYKRYKVEVNDDVLEMVKSKIKNQ